MTPIHVCQPLRGTRILIVEDEAILALDLALTIEDEGATVHGPLHRLEQALACDDLGSVDAALIDVDLAGREVFPLADRLTQNDIPIVFHTGRADLTRLRRKYPHARILRKPSPAAAIIECLAQSICASGSDVRVTSVAAS